MNLCTEAEETSTPGAGYAYRRSKAAECRREPRYPFTAAVEAADPRSEGQLEARTSDISANGCYVDAMNPFPTGCCIRIRLIHEGQYLESSAQVRYSEPGGGMGVQFMDLEPGQREILNGWLAEASGEDARTELGEANSTGAQRLTPAPHDSLAVAEGFALEKMVVLLLRKGVLSEDEAHSIMQRLLKLGH